MRLGFAGSWGSSDKHYKADKDKGQEKNDREVMELEEFVEGRFDHWIISGWGWVVLWG
jgi:hypothetical protein